MMALTLGGLDDIRKTRRRNPEAAQRAQSAFARRFYAEHPHACRACVGRYIVAWVLFHLLSVEVWWDCELNHRCYRWKAGTEPNRVGVPLCEKHHGRADKRRRKWEASWMGQYAPLITLARLWLLGYWILGLATYTAIGAAGYFTVPYVAAHLVISVAWR
jgi:hypothetical protein